MLSAAATTSIRTGDQALVREINLSIILNALRHRAPISRAKLAAATGLNKATVSSLVKELLEAKLVHEIGLGKNERSGRPGTMLELNPAAGCIVGVEVNSISISVVMCDFAASILWRRAQKLDRSYLPEEVLAQVLTALRETLTHVKEDGPRVLGIGLAVPGQRNRRSTGSRNSPEVTWREVPFQAALEREFGFPVQVGQEAHLAAMCETYWGAARGRQNVLYLGAGQDLAVAIVLDGRVLSGPPDPAGDVGHMTIDADGPECYCGNRGCWVTFSTESAVIRRIGESIAAGRRSSLGERTRGRADGLTIPLIVRAARAGDRVAIDGLTETGRYLGIGLVNLINAFNLEVVVFGGSLSEASDFLLPEINREVEACAAHRSRPAPPVLLAAYGADASVMGAIAAVYQRILSQPPTSLKPRIS